MPKPSRPSARRGAKSTLAVGLAAVAVSTAFAVFASLSTPVVRVSENRSADARVAWLSPPREEAPDIVVIFITDATVAKLPYRSPLDRRLVAELLLELQRKGVAAIGLDLLFDRPTEPAKDRYLRKTLKELKVPVVVASLSRTDGLDEQREHYLRDFLQDVDQALALVYRDVLDETVREVLVRRDDPSGPELGLATALAVGAGEPPPPGDRMQLDFRTGHQPGSSAFAMFPAEDVADLPEAWLRGRIALVGSDMTLVDRHRTPLSEAHGGAGSNMPGVLIHAHALSQILEGRSPRVPSPWDTVLLSAFGSLLGMLLAMARVGLAVKVAGAVALVPFYWLLMFAVYAFGGPLLPLVAPTLAYVLAAIALFTWQWRTEFRQRRFIHDAFGRFLAPSVVAQLVDDPQRLALSGESREITFLFTDIEGFTALAESTAPTDFVRLLNDYLDEACAIVIEHGGTIDKIVGDALHVMFNAPLVQADHAQRAVRCALALDDWARDFVVRMARDGFTIGVTRIGVNTGTAVVGNFGGSQRFDYTAHGDAINTAARLESVNKHLGTRVCVSASTAGQCTGVRFLPVGKLVLKGKSEGVDAYVPLADGSERRSFADDYQAAFDALVEQRADARAAFENLAVRYPDDPLVAVHTTRLAAGQTGTTIVLEEK